MKNLILIVWAILAFGSVSYAGEGYRNVNCMSASKRTSFWVSAPPWNNESQMWITVDGKSRRYLSTQLIKTIKDEGKDPSQEVPNHKGAIFNTVDSLTDLKVFATSVNNNDENGSFAAELVANPLSVKVKSLGKELTQASFEANLVSEDPRTEAGTRLNVKVRCNYEYLK